MVIFQTARLYGGAISVELPKDFIDVSGIRQVPDHQEVFIDKNGLTSIIFDILSRVDSAGKGDEAALLFHFNDIITGAADESVILSSAPATVSNLPQLPTYSLMATQYPRGPRAADNAAPDFTVILLVLIRLVEKKTDIVITVNVPHVPGQYQNEDVDMRAGRIGPLVEIALEYQKRIVDTFQIKDWSLFIDE